MTKVVAFGAFVEILPGVEGLVHISELADHHVENPSEVVEPGAKLNVKILEIDEERRRLSLSHQAGRGPEHADAGPRRQIAAADAGQGGGEEAAIDLAEDSAVEDQEVESPAIETETVAAEVPEGSSAEAAVRRPRPEVEAPPRREIELLASEARAPVEEAPSPSRIRVGT